MFRIILLLTAIAVSACSLSSESGATPTLDRPPFTIQPRNETPSTPATPAANQTATPQALAQGTTPLPTIVPTVAVSGALPPTVPAAQVAAYTPVDPAVRAIALSTTSGLRVGEVELPGGALAIAFNPVDTTRYARVDEDGMLRFAPLGGQEGVYSFAPYHDGFSAPSLAENPLRVVEVEWSPNGQMLAFRIDSDDPAANDGVWFWQPAREIATDPSYHLLRDCPPGCNLVERRNVQEWRSVSFDWSSDNQAILVRLVLPQNGGRPALTVRQAVRDQETRQSRVGPDALLYDDGYWAADGQRLVVSGTDSNGQVVFGTINRDGGSPSLTMASTIGLGWVQDAVQQPGTGQIVMLGSEGSAGGALRLYDSGGKALTDFIGSAAPLRVSWSPDRSAVLVTTQIGNTVQHFVANVDGSVTEITAQIGATTAVDWTPGGLPATAHTQQPVVPSGVVEGSRYRPGQQLRVYVEALNIHPEPSRDAPVLDTVTMGEYVAILAGPVVDQDSVWWRVQTVRASGWLAGEIDGSETLGP